jgi:peroxiredoxin
MQGLPLALGSKAPDFSLPGVDGQTYTLASFAYKKILIVVFSCNHCPYVQAYEDRLRTLQKKYLEKGVQIVAINSNDSDSYPEDSFENMVKRAKFKRYNFPYLHDDSQQVAHHYGASHTPEVFVFNQKRELAYYGKIDDNWKQPEKVVSKYLQNALDELLLNRQVSVPETFAVGCTIKWRTK